ncbi:MAG: transcription elongation factor GreA [Candidatus Woesearchaeota archaeon]
MAKKVFLTKKGLEKLKKRLKYLKEVERVKASNRIGEAKEYGDLSENSEYQSALENESEVENEIKQIEENIKNHVLVDEENVDTSSINVGCLVKLYDYDFDENVTYRISGSTESDVENGIISNESPIGSSLMGKTIGDIIEVKTPDGVIKFKVLDITV